jgi:hypothetical protein
MTFEAFVPRDEISNTSQRSITPEATRKVIKKEVDGSVTKAT